jgi:hypothetical protein
MDVACSAGRPLYFCHLSSASANLIIMIKNYISRSSPLTHACYQVWPVAVVVSMVPHVSATSFTIAGGLASLITVPGAYPLHVVQYNTVHFYPKSIEDPCYDFPVFKGVH